MSEQVGGNVASRRHVPAPWLGIFLVAACGRLASTAQADPQNGLVAYWDFDECSGIIVNDATGNDNDGLKVGGAWVSSPPYGCALEITGTGVVRDIPSSYDDTIGDHMTIAAWVTWRGPSSYLRRSQIFDSRDAVGPERYGSEFYISQSTHRVCFQLLRGLEPDYITVWSNATILVGGRTHVAAVLDRSTGSLSVYINGILDNSVKANGGYMQSNLTPAIGNNRWAPDDHQWSPLNGVVDELRIYDRALSPAEIEVLGGQPTPAESTTWGEVKALFR